MRGAGSGGARRPALRWTALTLLLSAASLLYLSSARRWPAGAPAGGAVQLPALPAALRALPAAAGAPAATYLVAGGGRVASFWHDVPLDAAALSSRGLVPMVCEIPAGARAKLEVATRRAWTPMQQDVSSSGAPRFYPQPSVLHYGAVPRTYSHPRLADAATGLRGDGDPLDVVDVSAQPAAPGEVYWVRVLGALAMVDGGAADWKIITIRASDPRARLLTDLADVVEVRRLEPAAAAPAALAHGGALRGEAQAAGRRAEAERLPRLLADFVTFLRDYKKKKPDDPSPVSFAFDGAFLDAAAAVAVVQRHHLHWCRMLAEAAAGVRVGSLSDDFRGYQTACDDTRATWPAGVDDAAADLLPDDGGDEGEPPLWVPVDAQTSGADVAAAVVEAGRGG